MTTSEPPPPPSSAPPSSPEGGAPGERSRAPSRRTLTLAVVVGRLRNRRGHGDPCGGLRGRANREQGRGRALGPHLAPRPARGGGAEARRDRRRSARRVDDRARRRARERLARQARRQGHRLLVGVPAPRLLGERRARCPARASRVRVTRRRSSPTASARAARRRATSTRSRRASRTASSRSTSVASASASPRRWRRELLSRLGDFLDERTGHRKLLAHALDEPIRGGARWAYVFGSALLGSFLVQAVTGVALMTSYAPSDKTAWASVHYITVQAGRRLARARPPPLRRAGDGDRARRAPRCRSRSSAPTRSRAR